MKNILRLAIMLLTCASPALANSCATTFSVNQNPISAQDTCSSWRNGATDGTSWGNVQVVSGVAHGTLVNGDPPFNDSTAIVPGAWGRNQTVTGTVSISSTPGGTQAEVELRTNTSITAGNITGYEFDASILHTPPTTNIYLVIVRWEGALNSFCYISNGSTCGAPVLVRVQVNDGDVLKATNVNGTLTFLVNNVSEATATDNTFTGGSPGVGFWNVGGTTADLLDYGFTDFTATDGIATVHAPVNAFTMLSDPVRLFRELLSEITHV